MTKILVIEDERSIRALISDILLSEDFEVIEAEDGQEGLELAVTEYPDLILCDVMMPELDGYGLLTTLQENQLMQKIPFIFLTAKATKDNIRQGMNLGADDYISKPFEEEDLLSTIKMRLQKKQVIYDSFQQEINQLRHSITAALPHEFRTPLSGILISTELLLSKLDAFDKNKIKDVVERIRSHANRLNDLTQKYLFYIKIQQIAQNQEQVIKLRNELLDEEQWQGIMSEIAMAKANYFNRSSDLKLNISGQIPIHIYNDNFYEIMKEVINNAFKFSQSGQVVEIITTEVEQKLSISVINQGRTITDEQIARIGAFMQFDREIYEQQGSGLGLAIVKSLVNLYGGNLLIDCEEDYTKVTIILP